MAGTPTASPFFRVLAAAITARIPVALEGDPGEAKTATMGNLARQLERHLETVTTATREATDFLGVQVEMPGGYIGYKPMRWVMDLNTAGSGLLFLDEINRGSREAINATLRVIQEGMVGDTPLGENVSIVAAMNPVASNPEVEELNSAMANRFLHLAWEFDEEEWLNNIGTEFRFVKYPDFSSFLSPNPKARRAVVAGHIATYHKHRRGKLKPGIPKDPVHASGAWPSPRSWTNLVDVLAHLLPGDDDAALLAAKGLVGEGSAVELFAWLVTADLHDPLRVMENPDIVDWRHERVDRLFALLESVTSIGTTNDKLWRSAVMVVVACADGGKPDAAMPAAQRLLSRIPQKESIPREAVDAFSGLLSKTKYRMLVG